MTNNHKAKSPTGYCQFNRFWLVAIASSGILASVSLTRVPAVAQIIPDATLGTENSTVIPNVTIKGLPSDQIDGGALRGNNLFHSFSQFNISDGQRVYFANPSGVQNILTRVTGANASNILGTLGVNGTANLFLVNPNGIIFGSNASLDIRGSFFATTAQSLVFPDGRKFSAVNPEAPPLLTINVTPGLQYGNSPGTIANAGNLSAGQNLTLAAGNLNLSGQLIAGGNLFLQATDKLRIRDSSEAPFIASAGGKMEVQGNAVDILALNHPKSGFYAGSDMIFRSADTVGGDAHYSTGGNFRIEKLDGSLGNLSSPYDPIILAGGDVSIGNYTGASLHILAGGSVQLGDVTINGVDSTSTSINPSNTTTVTGTSTTYSDLSPIKLSDNQTGFNIDGSNKPTLDVRSGIDWSKSPFTGTPSISVPTAYPAASVTFTTPTSSPGRADITVNSISVTQSNGLVYLSNQYHPNTALNGEIKTGSIDTSTNTILSNAGNVYIDSRNGIGINSSVDTHSSALLFGNGGDIILLATNNISTGSLNARSEILGYGGNITIRGGNINTDNIDTQSHVIFPVGSSGNIDIKANGSVTTGILDSHTEKLGSGGNIMVSGNGNIKTQYISSHGGSDGGNGGNINIRTNNGNITTENLNSSAANKLFNGGNINVTTNNGDVTGKDIDSRGGTLNGNGGDIDFRINGNLSIRSIKTGNIGYFSNSGDININAGENVNISNRITSASRKSSGNINVNAGGNIKAGSDSSSVLSNAGNITFTALGNITLLETFSGGGESGGNITVKSNQTVSVVNSVIQSGNYPGTVGDIAIYGQNLEVKEGGRISTVNRGNNFGGNLNIFTSESVIISGTSPDDLIPSSLITLTSRNGNAGNLNITTRQLTVSEGGSISAGSYGNGNAGNITINSQTISVQGTSINQLFSSGISVDNYGPGKAGELIFNTQQLAVLYGASISASAAFGASSGGSIIVNASESVKLDGTSTNGQIYSGIYAQSFARGNAGSIDINTDNLKIANGARVTVSSDSQSEDAGNLLSRINTIADYYRASDPNFPKNTVLSLNSQDAGSINVKADNILMKNQAQIIAISSSGEGGNINLQVRDLILMRHNSLISATAGTAKNGGNGGNININTQFVVGVPQENSDITANAFLGRGGNINITAYEIYGLKFRPSLTSRSDITVSSDFGPPGTVEINTPGIDTSRGLIQLPQNFAIPQIAQGCQATENQARFFRTGNGGLPPNPGEAPSSQNIWPFSPTSSVNSAATPNQLKLNNSLVEAQGWIVDNQGNVVLTAQSHPTTPQPSKEQALICGNHHES